MLGKTTVVLKNSITCIVRVLHASKILVSVCVYLGTVKKIAFTQKVKQTQISPIE